MLCRATLGFGFITFSSHELGDARRGTGLQKGGGNPPRELAFPPLALGERPAARQTGQPLEDCADLSRARPSRGRRAIDERTEVLVTRGGCSRRTSRRRRRAPNAPPPSRRRRSR